jgi:glycosyltransferase involved in cell wall biosynthesis
MASEPARFTVAVIIPALNEEEAVGDVVRAVPRQRIDEIIVVDNGSTDATDQVATAAGARVVREDRRGYGYACLAGANEADSDVLVFLDADGTFDPAELSGLVAPIASGEADLVLGSRELGVAHQGALLPHQRFGNWLAVAILRWVHHLPITDLGPYRAIRAQALRDMAMSELTYGWTVEMMVKAAQIGLRVAEVPVSCRPRQGGESKVAGNLRGSVLAGYRIISVALRHARGGPVHDG